ncbi:uncharacterized protein TNCV_610731 [Trichonephila clavipes]|nr:uncharacterized protein TNCV_610731 [Trichonephila clavipes]
MNPGYPSDPSLFSTLLLVIQFILSFISRLYHRFLRPDHRQIKLLISAVSGFCQIPGTLPALLDSVVVGGTPEWSCVTCLWILTRVGKGLVLPTLNVDRISTNSRFLLISLPNNELSKKSPFAIHKALIGIGGEPKSVKRLRFGDLPIEMNSALRIKSFLLAKSFLDCPVSIVPHKSFNSCGGVISEPDLLTTTDTEILDGLSGQGVIQVRRITIKKDASVIPTKHIILTFNSPKLPTTIKADYFNCKILPYIPNPLKYFNPPTEQHGFFHPTREASKTDHT